MSSNLVEANAALTTAIFAVGAVAATSMKYMEQVFMFSQNRPRELALGFFAAAWYFSYNLMGKFSISFTVN